MREKGPSLGLGDLSNYLADNCQKTSCQQLQLVSNRSPSLRKKCRTYAVFSSSHLGFARFKDDQASYVHTKSCSANPFGIFLFGSV